MQQGSNPGVVTVCAPEPVVIGVDALPALFSALRAWGYTVVGPTVRDGAIVLSELESAAELPYGWGVETEAGQYRVRRRSDTAAFGHSAGPQSWKNFLHPPRARMWSADRTADAVTVSGAGEQPRYALLGVRPCDVRAIGVLDRVLSHGQHADAVYSGRRDGAFVIAVECTEPGATCFCASMGCGPDAQSGYDLALTELVDGDDHRFVARSGTEAGARLLAQLPQRPADDATVHKAQAAVKRAATEMGRAMPEVDLPRLMTESRESPHWDDVASRCLTCGNCTMVCPTCFCTATEDVTDLTGDHAERWSVWDSCFSLDFTGMHGGEVRVSGQSRYRQWISHKLGTWHEQFGSSGCVGCGRCIVWCPVGIDITQEAAALAALRPPSVLDAAGGETADAEAVGIKED
ncbi:4Fe-4S dicluster domain-containing protein [Actinocrinis puniceicyclus]|uniref:4Fe-4S dicluster domain-containing protein n=1 Tax=Actinocrinis puniceicyclus TaxID=977794 RepID=A0A8J8BC11_9ACTN|nr:4Fe-4S dicluster domain-containing protein [Actinocrinis puniceicyclus]MBS2964627.1 4Fe-4S dicluster domain-containing protein [Actinocrinis puniceicyclus]